MFAGTLPKFCVVRKYEIQGVTLAFFSDSLLCVVWKYEMTKWWPKGIRFCVFCSVLVVFRGAGVSNFGHFRAPETPGGDFVDFPEHHCGVLEAPQDAHWETVGPHCTRVRVWKLF